MRQTLPLRPLLVAGCYAVFAVGHAAALDAAKFAGLWELDFDRTMEEAKKSPKYKPAEAEKMPAMIKGMMERMKLKFSDQEFAFVQGGKETSVPYTVQSGTDTSAVLGVRQGGKDFTLTVTLIDGKFLKVKSSGTDDLDYLIWKHTP
jgi:hypothetical protein